MNNMINDLIEYKGVSSYIPEGISSRKEFNLEEIVNLNDKYTVIDQIVKVSVNATCNNARVIKTPIGVSLDGDRLTGRKVLISSNFNIRIEYLSKENKIYSIKINKGIYISVIVDEGDLIRRNNIASIFIEDISGKLLNDNEILILIYGIFIVE